MRISDWSSDVCSSDLELFDRARFIIEQRAKRLSDEEMLALLSDILAKNGHLSGLIIDEFEGGTSSSAYQSRFGSLLRAYSLVGHIPDNAYRFLEITRALRRMPPSIGRNVLEGVHAVGGKA